MLIIDKTVKLEKITLSRKKNKQKLNWVRLAERNRIPMDIKYINPRVTFDGIHWWISVGVAYTDNTEIPMNEGIGIDLGIKDLAICSDVDKPYKNINKTLKIRKLKKKKRRLQRKVTRKYLLNKEGNSYCKTSNIIKAEKRLLWSVIPNVSSNRIIYCKSRYVEKGMKHKILYFFIDFYKFSVTDIMSYIKAKEILPVETS